MYRFAAHWAGAFLGVLLVAAVLHPNIRLPEAGSGIYWATAAAFSAVLAALNTYVRPPPDQKFGSFKSMPTLLYLATLPLTCCFMVLTLGLGHFLVGAFMFWLAGQIIEQIHVESFGWAVLGSLITAVISTIVSWAVSRPGANRGKGDWWRDA